MNRSRGFTLIELLVVISIIGVLSSVVLASLKTARVRGRDAARYAQVKQIKTAMEVYYNDKGTYPKHGTTDTVYDLSVLSSYLVPTYISSIYVDPRGAANYYTWGSGGGAYGMWIYTEAAGQGCLSGSTNMDTGWWGALGEGSICKF